MKSMPGIFNIFLGLPKFHTGQINQLKLHRNEVDGERDRGREREREREREWERKRGKGSVKERRSVTIGKNKYRGDYLMHLMELNKCNCAHTHNVQTHKHTHTQTHTHKHINK